MDDCPAGMAREMGQEKDLPTKVSVEHLNQSAVLELARHQYVTAQSDALSADCCFDSVGLFPEAEKLEFRSRWNLIIGCTRLLQESAPSRDIGETR
jgi:hypothetical protein